VRTSACNRAQKSACARATRTLPRKIVTPKRGEIHTSADNSSAGSFFVGAGTTPWHFPPSTQERQNKASSTKPSKNSGLSSARSAAQPMTASVCLDLLRKLRTSRETGIASFLLARNPLDSHQQ